ncbi:DUF2190 family protein [Ferrimonas aestuarii]|nr:DUF2190 family protein [Ferrimonas aestuarii]
MKNYNGAGDQLELIAPADGVIAGKPVLIGALVVIPMTTAASSEPFIGYRCGEYTVPVALTGAVTQGAKAYLKSDGSAITGTASGNTLVGAFLADLASDAADGLVLFTGQIA